MRVAEARASLLGLLEARGLVVSQLDGESAMSMLDFYATVRAEDVDVDRDGDMVLFQWGTYRFAGMPSFHYDMTRQFMTPDGEDESIWQLSITLHFEPDEATKKLGHGDRWCARPDELPSLREFIEQAPPTAYARTTKPTRVAVRFEPAG